MAWTRGGTDSAQPPYGARYPGDPDYGYGGITTITNSGQYPFGAIGESYTGSISGFPPSLHSGKVLQPKDEEEAREYIPLAKKLEQAMLDALNAAGFLPTDVLDVELRTPSSMWGVAMFDLACITFCLAEAVDRNHTLVKIATETEWNNFKNAILELP
jgi:hypothetical protein